MNLDKRVPVGIGVVVERGGQFLLGKRKGAHAAGTWSFPGGKPDGGESPEQAALRELWEETGINAYHATPLGVWTYDRFEDEGLHYVTLYFLVDIEDQEPENREPEKCEGWEWFDPAELPAPLFCSGIVRAVNALGYSTQWAH